MELFLSVLVVLCGSALAKPLEGRWVFPDELDALTKKPNRFEFFKPNTTPKSYHRPEGRKIDETMPPPDVLFHLPNCKCKYPPQYNPVCGTNNVSYVNAQMLMCARVCGAEVAISRMGTCSGRFSVDR